MWLPKRLHLWLHKRKVLGHINHAAMGVGLYWQPKMLVSNGRAIRLTKYLCKLLQGSSSTDSTELIRSGWWDTFTLKNTNILQLVLTEDSDSEEDEVSDKTRRTTRSSSTVSLKKWKKALDPNNPLD